MNKPVADGKIYALRRGQELIIRRAQVYLDRVELLAETDRPEDYPTITLADLDGDPGKQIHALGLLYCVIAMVV